MTHAAETKQASGGHKRVGLGLQVYALTWVLLAGGASYYLATSVAWPDLMARYGRSPLDLKQQSNEAQRAQASLASELEKSQSDLDRLRTEVQRLRSEAGDRAAEVASLRSELERAKAAVSVPIATAPAAPTAEPAPTVALRETQPAPQPLASLPGGPIPPLPPRAPRDVTLASRIIANSLGNPLIVNPVTTGSISRLQPPVPAAPPVKPQDRAPQTEPAAPPASGPITFGEPVVTAAPAAATGADGVALRLSTAPSLDSLRLSWRVLNERHGSLLQGLEPRYRAIPGGATGTAYQLLAGPVLSRAEGDQLCTMLRVQSVICSVDSFAGDAL